MTDQPKPRPLADADLLAWTVVLSYRDQQERDGIKILALPFPPCPTCGETVHKAVASWVREPFREEVTIDVQPCGHAHTATFADLERIHDHASEMLASLRLDARLPGGEGRSTDDIVREARTRVGEPARWCCSGNAEDCPLCDTRTLPYPWICPGHPETEANWRRVQAAADTELTAKEARDLVDELGTDLYWAHDRLAFVAECCDIADREQRPITTADVREWLKGARCGRQLAADAAAARHDAGPTVAECAEADTRWWGGEKAGE